MSLVYLLPLMHRLALMHMCVVMYVLPLLNVLPLMYVLSLLNVCVMVDALSLICLLEPSLSVLNRLPRGLDLPANLIMLNITTLEYRLLVMMHSLLLVMSLRWRNNFNLVSRLFYM